MDKLKKLRQSIIQVMDDYIAEESPRPNNLGLEFRKILDDKQHQYQLVQMGWDGGIRVYDLIFHADIRADKIWIHEDSLEESLAERLIDKGLSKKDIVLAYFPEDHRAHTQYALA